MGKGIRSYLDCELWMVRCEREKRKKKKIAALRSCFLLVSKKIWSGVGRKKSSGFIWWT